MADSVPARSRRRAGLIGPVPCLGLIVGLLALAGCAGHLDSETPRTEVQRLADVYRRCATEQAERLARAQPDQAAEPLAIAALNRCQPAWRDYTNASQQRYALRTHDVSRAHELAMSQGFELNIHLKPRLVRHIQVVREGGATD